MSIKSKLGNLNEVFIKYGKVNGGIVILSKLLYRVTIAPIVRFYSNCNVSIKKNRILFASNPDFSDNARALFDYMVEQGYNEKYELIWLVEHPEKYAKFEAKNVKFVRGTGKYSHCKRLKFYQLVYSANYIFFTHSFNWSHKKNREKQHYINLWHGCGYKAAKGGSEEITFDYALVPGEVFIKTKQEFFQCEKDKILPIGYPRYDLLKKENKKAAAFIDQVKKERNAERAVLWMPTYRNSYRAKLSENTLEGELGLPIIESMEELVSLDSKLRESKAVVMIRKHFYQMGYDTKNTQFSNIIFLEDAELERMEIQLYELLSVTDGLITDYSSVAIDYLLLNRPVAFTLDDYEKYKESRGFVFEDPLQYMPGHHVYNKSELMQFIEDVVTNNDEYEQARLEVLKQTHNICEGYNKRILDYFGL